MNIIFGLLSANFTANIISGITTTINGVHTIKETIKNNTSTGATAVKQIIKESDVEVKLKTMYLFLCEIQITNKTPYTIIYCINEIKKLINDIKNELDVIKHRLHYNNNLWIGSTIRSYKFHNCKIRLNTHLKNLDIRYQQLVSLLSIENNLFKNHKLENDLTHSVIFYDTANITHIDTKDTLEIEHV